MYVKSLRDEFISNEGTKLVEVNRRAQRIPRSEREPVYSIEHAYLFQIFHDLHSSRSHNGWSYNPISYSELDAYQRLTNTQLSVWEVRMLQRIDRIFLAAVNKSQEIKSKSHR